MKLTNKKLAGKIYKFDSFKAEEIVAQIIVRDYQASGRSSYYRKVTQNFVTYFEIYVSVHETAKYSSLDNISNQVYEMSCI